jgi:peptide/nickel transport system substrate-binding protein
VGWETVAHLDPARGYDAYDILPYTNDGLVAFRRAGGPQAAGLVADLAVSVPTPTDGGRTYAFRLRRGIRYSTGAPVRASDIRRGLERVLRVGRETAVWYAGIRGAARCVGRSARCDLSHGIEVDDAAGTIIFRLTEPDPDFRYKLALPNAVAVPPGVGRATIRRPLPATGPYMVTHIRPKRTLRLARNPHFRPVDGRPDGYPDAITFDSRLKPAGAIRAVQQGRADHLALESFAFTGGLRAQVDVIATRYAGQLHATPQTFTLFAMLNTRVAPFDNVDVRRAVNYAVDRGAFVALKGGDRFAQAACQFLPPNAPGYRLYCPYTAGAGAGRAWSAPDLAQARRLVTRSHTRGMRVTVLGHSPSGGGEARLLKETLDQLGYRTRVRLLPADKLNPYVGDSRHRAQIAPAGWFPDFPAASAYLEPNFSCRAFVPGTPQLNLSEFCDARTERLMQRAQRLNARGASADDIWAEVDRRIVDQAASLPLLNSKAVSFVSRRVGNYQFSQQWGVLLDQLWVR